MNSMMMKGVIRNGRVEFDAPINLPDGTEVVVTAGATAADGDEPMSPEEIGRVLAAMEKVQPFDMTDAERAAWQAERQAQKAWADRCR